MDTNTLLFISSVLATHLLAVMSPGPDFIVAVRNALNQGRKAGLATAFGILLANFIHVGYSLGGLGLLVAKSDWLFTIVRYAGAVYLLYIGVQSIRAKVDVETLEKEVSSTKTSTRGAVKNGFLTSVLNPKAALYYIMMFSVVIDPGKISTSTLAIVAIVMLFIVITWFSSVALFFTHPAIRQFFERYQRIFNRVFGVMLIALGLKVALGS